MDEFEFKSEKIVKESVSPLADQLSFLKKTSQSHTLGFETTSSFDPVDNSFNSMLIKNVHDVNKEFKSGGLRNPPITDKETVYNAELFLYPPKKNYAYKVRPQMYNFNSVDAILAIGNNIQENRPALNAAMYSEIPEINGMILPSTDGHLVNLTKLDDCWSFVLITDGKRNDGYNSYQTDSKVRTMSTGFCIGEPVNPNTGTPNPDSIFKFCYHSRFRYNKTREGNYSPRGETIGHIDVVPTEFKASVDPGEKDGLMNLSPQFMAPAEAKTYAQKHLLDNDHKEDYADAVVNVLEGVSEFRATKIHGSLKSSKEHLYRLMSSIDEAKHADDDVEDVDYKNLTGQCSGLEGPVSRFDMFFHKLSTKKNIIESGISSFEVKSMRQMLSHYPMMQIKVNKIKNARSWDVYPSHLISDNNTYSAWITNVLTHLCEASGVMEVSFAYDSYTGNIFQKEGRWKFNHLFTIHSNDHEYETYLLKSIQKELEGHIFSFLKHCKGDFTLFAHYRTCSDTIMELNFYSENAKMGAYYEHPSDKPGLVSPNIGSMDYWNHNAEQLTDFLYRFNL